MEKKRTYIGTWIRNWYEIFIRELKLIFHDEGALVVFFLGGLLYPLLYNVIYHDGTVDEMPIAVVDMSQGSYSRRYLEKLDATRECDIAYSCISLAEAEDLMRKGKVHGIIYIPVEFDTNLVRMEQAMISTYADMSSLLYYKSLTTATSAVMIDEMHVIQAEHYAAAGYTGEAAEQLIKPIQVDSNIPYNPAFSYTIFFLSAALLLVLQQTMFYGSSILAGTLREQKRSFAELPGKMGVGVNRVVLGRGMAYFLVYIVIGVLVAQLMPWLFHLPQHANPYHIFLLLCFYLWDCVFFSFAWSTLITKRETVFVLLLFISPVCLFLTGFSWPVSSFPKVWQWFSYIFPSTFGCRAFINLNSATGSLAIIAPEIVAMTIQIVVYYFLACLAVYVEGKIIKHRDKIEAYRQEAMRRRGLDPEETAWIIGGQDSVDELKQA